MFLLDWKFKGQRKTKPNLGRLSLKRSQLAIERLSRFRFFSTADYVSMHPDIGALHPAVHYVGHGADERRRAAKAVHIARTLGEIVRETPAFPQMEKLKFSHSPKNIGLYVSSLSNVFMREIASALGCLLRSAGHHTLEMDENSDIDNRPEHCIFVAPHEFFFLGRGPSWVRDDVLAEACMYCTEQVQSQWFWETLHIVLMAKSVIDMSMPIAAAFAEVMPSRCIFPSVERTLTPIADTVKNHPLLAGQRWWMDREMKASHPLDLCFLGTVSPYRARFFARNADRISRYESFLYLRTGNAAEPMSTTTDEVKLIEVAQYVARNARILLNIHRDEFPYFEWHRIVYQGMANGCVVVSEPCFVNPEYEPGVHYLADESHHLMELLEWILNDEDGRAKASAVAEAGAEMSRNPEKQAARARMLVDLLME